MQTQRRVLSRLRLHRTVLEEGRRDRWREHLVEQRGLLQLQGLVDVEGPHPLPAGLPALVEGDGMAG